MADSRFTLTWDEVHRADSKKIGGQICLRTCPWCGHNDYRLKIDPDTGAYFCHDDKCEAKGVVTNADGAGESWRPNTPEVHAKAPDTPKKFSLPDLSRAQGINQQVIDYMATRGISEETCRKMRLGFENHPGLGPSVIFPSFDKAGKKVINVKYRKIASKDFRNSPDTYRPFFGLTTLTEPAQPVIIVEGECLTGEAEVLTPQGWVRFDQYSGQPVAQVHEGGKITMTDPLAVVRKQYTGDLLRFQNSQRFQTTVTPGHRMITMDNRDRWREWLAEDGTSSADSIPRVGELDGPGIPLTDDQIALAIAVSADGTIDNRTRRSHYQPAEDRYVRFGFKKDRKVERLRGILDRLGIKASDNPIADGYQSICFPLPAWVPGRMLPHEWITLATSEQREFILAEIVEWDGNSVPNRNQHEYSSKHLANVEFVQAIAHTSGRVSTIIPRFNERGEWYKASILHSKASTSMQPDSMQHPERIAHDGTVYCVTVPTGMFLVREAGCITVTGNCDVLALVECGFSNVLSIPDGSNAKGSQGKKLNCLPSAEKELIAARRVIIATDGDDAGRAMAQELATRIGMDKVAFVEFPDDAKDANDYLMMHGKEALTNLIHSATSPVIDGVSKITDYQEDIWEHRHLFGKDGYTIPGMDGFSELCRFHPGSLVIVTGVPGAGKSSFLRAAMILLAGSRDDFPVAMFAPEDAPMPRKFFEKFVRLVSGSSVAEMGRANYEMVVDLVKEKVLLIHPESNSLDDILLRAEYTVLNHGAKVIVIDPWTEVVTTRERGEGEVEHINKCLSRVQRFARDKGVVVIISAHPTKQGVERSKGNDGVVQLFDISGTASWNNKADFGISIKRSTEHPDSIVSEIHVVKVRDGDYGKLGSVEMSHNPRTGQYKEL